MNDMICFQTRLRITLEKFMWLTVFSGPERKSGWFGFRIYCVSWVLWWCIRHICLYIGDPEFWHGQADVRTGPAVCKSLRRPKNNLISKASGRETINHSHISGTGREWQKSIPRIHEREGNEKIHSHNSGIGIRGFYSWEWTGTRMSFIMKKLWFYIRWFLNLVFAENFTSFLVTLKELASLKKRLQHK